jgi:hypothetical protein
MVQFRLANRCGHLSRSSDRFWQPQAAVVAERRNPTAPDSRNSRNQTVRGRLLLSPRSSPSGRRPAHFIEGFSSIFFRSELLQFRVHCGSGRNDSNWFAMLDHGQMTNAFFAHYQ